MKLILGSSSPNRKEMLDRMGLQYEVVLPDYEEVIDESASTVDQVQVFAEGKGQSVYKKVQSAKHKAQSDEDFLILAFDSMIACEGRTIGKAYTKKQAFEDIQSFVGKEQQVVTGMAVLGRWKGQYVEKVVYTSTTVRFRSDITNCQIRAYLEAEDWSGKCGSYSILGAGVFLLDSIDGDFQNIVGIPVIQMGHTIREITGKGIYSVLSFNSPKSH